MCNSTIFSALRTAIVTLKCDASQDGTFDTNGEYPTNTFVRNKSDRFYIYEFIFLLKLKFLLLYIILSL